MVFPSSRIWNFNCQRCHDRPYFPICHIFFKDRLSHLLRNFTIRSISDQLDHLSFFLIVYIDIYIYIKFSESDKD